MPTTSNFGWTTPADTDLVKDGAAAIRTLGNGVDASFVDLKGGTTGQVLSKASNTDLDFSWVAQDDSNAIQNALLTTTGDTIYASAASTPARLGIGTTGQVLTVSGGLPVWATASSGGMTLLSTTTLSGAQDVTVSSISGSYEQLYCTIVGHYGANNGQNTLIRLNGETGSNYGYLVRGTNDNFASIDGNALGSSTAINTFLSSDTTDSNNMIVFSIPNYASSTGHKILEGFGKGTTSGTVTFYNFQAVIRNITTAINSITIRRAAGNWSGGTLKIYGVK